MQPNHLVFMRKDTKTFDTNVIFKSTTETPED